MNLFLTTAPSFWESFLSYQFKVALILSCFYLLYRLLMSKETFHKLNRFLLVGMLVASFALPFCVITIHRLEPEQALASTMTSGDMNVPVAEIPSYSEAFREAVPDASGSVMTEPVSSGDEVSAAGSEISAPVPVKERKPFNWWLFVMAVWFAGCMFHLSRTILSVIQVRRLVRTAHKVYPEGNCRIYIVDLNISPFSWMNRIVMSTQDYESDNRRVIIDHEMTHARLGHSMDLILVDLLSAMQWFNPVTVMLRKDLQDVHEFQADGRVLQDGFDAKEYQYMLLGKVASMSGYSVTNHFKKQNLSNRIDMMNRKDSKYARALKALYAPLLTGVVLMSFAVTVYDCKPSAQPQGESQSKTVSGGKRNVDVLRDSMQILDEIYGQGKFNRFPWETGGVWLTEGDTVIVRTGDRHEAVMKPEEVADYLLDYKGFNTHRITIVLSKLDGDQTETGLMRARPLVDMLNEVGIYSLVVKTDAEWMEAYYSTYKYGRIYVWEKGKYELDYNGLVVRGTPRELTDWIKALDIEYMAFFPDEKMPWSDASVMMKAAYERGSRTFSICVCESSGAKSALAELLSGPKDPGTLSREQKENGFYRTTVLPVKRDLDKEFKGKTVMDVERRIREEYTDDYIKKAIKVVDHPSIFRGSRIDKVVFTENELVLIKKYSGLGRNVWFRPDVDAGVTSKVIADGKEYKFLREEGLQNFSDYPWHDEYNYANGSYFWVPEQGSLYCVDVYEAIPVDVKSFDVIEYDSQTLRKEYLAKGVNISGDPNMFKDIQVVDAACYVDLELPRTAGPNQAIVQRIEITPSATTVYLDVVVRADVSYPAYFGSDLTLMLNDGTKLALVSANQPLDQDFRRGGDYVATSVELVYPSIDPNQLLPDRESGKQAVLSGTVCHINMELPFSYVNYMPRTRR